MSEAPAKIYIAVIDDDESLCRSLARLLQACDVQAVTYLSAEAFLSDTKRPVFDGLIIDIQLGGMSGIELGRRLANEGAMPPPIFITAHEEGEALAQRSGTPYLAVLRKTDPAEVVLAAVRSSIEQTRRRHGQA